MVLTLKRWKSRSSPGIIAGALREKPIHKSGPFLASLEGPFAALLVFLGLQMHSRAPHGASGLHRAALKMVTRGGAARQPFQPAETDKQNEASGLHRAALKMVTRGGAAR